MIETALAMEKSLGNRTTFHFQTIYFSPQSCDKLLLHFNFILLYGAAE